MEDNPVSFHNPQRRPQPLSLLFVPTPPMTPLRRRVRTTTCNCSAARTITLISTICLNSFSRASGPLRAPRVRKRVRKCPGRGHHRLLVLLCLTRSTKSTKPKKSACDDARRKPRAMLSQQKTDQRRTLRRQSCNRPLPYPARPLQARSRRGLLHLKTDPR